MAPLLEFKAGKAFRRGETNWVDPNPNRGLVYLQEEDDLLHFYYKDLVTGAIDDLIIFPGDATFSLAQPRVHVLKFNSSSDRHFFWLQDVEPTRDEEIARRVNELFGAEVEDVEESGMEVEGIAPAAPNPLETPAPTRAFPSSSSAPAPGAPKKALGSEAQLAQLRDILAGFKAGGALGGGSGSALGTPDFLLTDVLTSNSLTTLLDSSPDLAATLLPFLPPTVPQTPHSLTKAVNSIEFKRSVASLDRALRTGALGPLVAGLGLGEESAMGVDAFLKGVQEQADKSGGESSGKMDED
ncbi:adhesion regulating molecule [Meredithblackwellia eburnea MCA 4105]